MLRKVAFVAVIAALLVPMAYAQTPPRVSASEKGSLLVFPKVQLMWNAAGTTLLQDTFIDIVNDFNADVLVHMFFVSETCTNVDNVILLTQNQPAYWSALTGMPGPSGNAVSPFTVLGAPYLDPEGSGNLVLRGFIVMWAENPAGEQIRWNHLKGEATLVNYANSDAWEYNAYAFAAVAGVNGAPIGVPGVLALNGAEYAFSFDKLLLDFFASGSTAFTTAGYPTITIDTDLALLIVDMDLRQETTGPFTTKAKFYIWNENETSFSGAEFCLTKWDESLLSSHGGHFLVGNLQTNKGKAWIDGLASPVVCPDSTARSLLGVQAKRLTFGSGPTAAVATAGGNLVGIGTEATTILYDVMPGGGEKMLLKPGNPLMIKR